MNFTAEQIAKAKTAKSAEELITLAKESGIELTGEEIKAQYYAMHKEGELAAEELANVSGGCGRKVFSIEHYKCKCPFCGQKSEITVTDFVNNETEYDIHSCSCGANIELYLVLRPFAKYIKNGKEITVKAIRY